MINVSELPFCGKIRNVQGCGKTCVNTPPTRFFGSTTSVEVKSFLFFPMHMLLKAAIEAKREVARVSPRALSRVVFNIQDHDRTLPKPIEPFPGTSTL